MSARVYLATFPSLKNPVHVLFCVVFLGFAVARGAPDAEPTAAPFTAKEIAQGFREHVIVARPLPGRRAIAAAEEAREGVRVRETFARFGELRVIDLDATDTAGAAITRLQATGRYEFVEPDFLRQLAVEPNDPQFTNGALWAMKNTGQSGGVAGADIKATAAWDLVHDAPTVIVAVVDTGVNLNHQDIAGNLWRNPSPTFGDINGARYLNGQQTGTPTDDAGHGTHVAGTIGAIGDNNLAVTGVAWKVQIMPVKVFPATGSGSTTDIARGVNYAISHGAHIINASYGALGSTGFSNTELAAITAARDAGIIFVAAAGNDASNMDVSRFYPASHALDNIVTVGNSTRRDELSTSSNYGSAVDLFAPGSEIVSLNYANTTGTTTLSGTSMAAPHVTGALALLKARFPNDNYRQLINRLLRGVDVGGRFLGKAQTGGRLNLLGALTTTTNRPFNDDFAGRPSFTSANLRLRASNAGGTAEPGEPGHAGAPAANSIWWEWTAPTSGAVTLSTSGSNYDTLLAVYTGTTLGALTPVAANDNDGGNPTSRLTFPAVAGTTYQIAVDGRNGANGLTMLNLGTTPANDNFAAPVALNGESTQLTATNANCSRETGEPRIGAFAGGTSLWYRWTAPRTGRFQVAAVSNDFDPILTVYTGQTLATLTAIDPALNVSANDKSNGAVWTINAIGGVSYLITVDAKSASTSGQFTLSLTDSLWQTQVGDAVTGGPAIARDGSVYFGGIDRSLYALDATGAVKWSFATGGLIDTCSPAVADDGSVYVGSNDGTFYAFTADGTPKWTRAFGTTAPVSNSPALAADGTIYVKAGNGFLYALNPADGAIKWRFNVNATTSYASPSVAPDGTIYQGSEDKKLYALNPDGTLKWTYTADNDIYTVAAIDTAGNLYFGVLNSGKLFSVTANGTLRWTYSGASIGSSSSPALSPDGATVYFGGYDSKLHAVNATDGSARWTYNLGSEVRASSPAVDSNGVIYLGCYDNRIYAINAAGSLKRTYDVGNWVRSSPAISGTTLYVGSNDHKVYAFDLGAGPATGPWPQYRHNARRTGRALTETFAVVTQPQSQVTVVGSPLILTLLATGDGPLSYQWRKDGTLINGATSPTLTVASATAVNAGVYTAVITGPKGTLTTNAATVTVETPRPGRLTNLSVRTAAGTSTQTLTVGFVLNGTPDKTVLIRAIGPTLADFGVTGALADPRLQLFTGTTLLVENDNWFAPAAGTTPAKPNSFDLSETAVGISAVFAASGAFGLPANSLDAAIVRTMPAGSYTAQISGTAGTGIALAELYDTSPASGARLGNVSARAQVGTGDNILIAGFSISGNVPKQILIRGIGPGLTQFGVTGVLANPTLALYRGANKVTENDDWGGSTALSTVFRDVGAFALPSTTSRDSALLVTLAPGSYTAQVSGVNNTSGVALIELYEIP